MTAVDLAKRLRVDPRMFRAWLRRQADAGHPLLKTHQHGERWTFRAEEAAQLEREFQQDASCP